MWQTHTLYLIWATEQSHTKWLNNEQNDKGYLKKQNSIKTGRITTGEKKHQKPEDLPSKLKADKYDRRAEMWGMIPWGFAWRDLEVPDGNGIRENSRTKAKCWSGRSQYERPCLKILEQSFVYFRRLWEGPRHIYISHRTLLFSKLFFFLGQMVENRILSKLQSFFFFFFSIRSVWINLHTFQLISHSC